MDTPPTAVDVVYTPILARSCWTLTLSTVAMRKGPNFPRTHAVDSDQLLAPFVAYADFESILQRVDDDEAMDTTQGVAAGDGEPTTASGPFQGHLTCSFAYKVVSSVVLDFFRPLVSYRGEDAGEMFVRKLQEEPEQLFQEYIATPQQLLELTEAELRSFHTAISCHMQPFAGRGQCA